MITNLLISVFFAAVQLIVGLIPVTDPPSWLSSGSGYFSTIWATGAGLGAWIPWTLVITVLSAVLVCLGIGFGIKVSRIVASFLTFGGGSAA